MHLQNSPEFGDYRDMIFKKSPGTPDLTAFPKLKVKVRPEVVSLGLVKSEDTDINPNEITGVHLKPEDLKKWYESGEDFEIIDMRNDYEFKVGHFKNSMNPELVNFRDLPSALPKLEPLKEASKKGKKILTVCTGGIRCEKASGYLVKKGFDNVYQLDGGMHTYMEKYPDGDFLGALYVFDGRETMDFAEAAGVKRAVVGKCDVCHATTEKYTNCANIECHMKMLCCESCIDESKKVAEELIEVAVAECDTESSADGIVDGGKKSGKDRVVEINKILDVAKGFVFCSDECREKCGVENAQNLTPSRLVA